MSIEPRPLPFRVRSLQAVAGPLGVSRNCERDAFLRRDDFVSFNSALTALAVPHATLTTEFLSQPRARELPVAHDTLRRDFQDVSSLFN